MFPTNEEILEFYKNEYIKRHGLKKFEEEILFFYAFNTSQMMIYLMTDYINHNHIK